VHAPVPSQVVAPQVASAMEQAAMQQLPVPLIPQAPEPHEAFEVQGVPGASTGTQALLEQ
jgi:hypothetical protein